MSASSRVGSATACLPFWVLGIGKQVPTTLLVGGGVDVNCLPAPLAAIVPLGRAGVNGPLAPPEPHHVQAASAVPEDDQQGGWRHTQSSVLTFAET